MHFFNNQIKKKIYIFCRFVSIIFFSAKNINTIFSSANTSIEYPYYLYCPDIRIFGYPYYSDIRLSRNYGLYIGLYKPYI